ncbi:hypothetical protein [Prevotella pallens]|uniref:hypothetical protein n=1 Tax=Prevotella pallens TaxID=60133 RepID=UPI0028DD38FE|nr:hypothetical protein [Prevotella pallens]
MKETSIIQTQEGDEYILSVNDVDITMLSDDIQQMLLNNNLQIGEIIIERTAGKQYTCYKVLYQIATWLASIFAQHQGLILYYLCDDMNSIPNRNTKGKNKDLSPQEYRSRLFSKLFEGYKKSHQVVGISDYPIIIEGEGYKKFIHLIARASHKKHVLNMSNYINAVWGKG